MYIKDTKTLTLHTIISYTCFLEINGTRIYILNSSSLGSLTYLYIFGSLFSFYISIILLD